MTILARTAEYLVEFDAGFLTIARYSDGWCKGMKGKGIAGQFRECLKKCGAERTIECYLRMARKFEWEPLYKAHRMPGADAEWDKETGVVFPQHAA